jgi:hypothetical protein
VLNLVLGENAKPGSAIGGDENRLGKFDKIEKAKRKSRGASCKSRDRESFTAGVPPRDVKVVRKPPGPNVKTATRES